MADAVGQIAAGQPLGIDIGASAQVFSSDFERMYGVRNKRLEEFPAEELHFETFLSPEGDNCYAIPYQKGLIGCIGLQWLERRQLVRLALKFAQPDGLPDPAGVQLQYWAFGFYEGAVVGIPAPESGSRWQGHWRPFDGDLRREGGLWVFDIKWESEKEKQRGALKVRWLIPTGLGKLRIQSLSAYTDSNSDTADILLQIEKPVPGETARISMYNGEVAGGDAGVASSNWDLSGDLVLPVRYHTPDCPKSDRTVMRLSFPGGGFGVAVDDILANDGVYAKDWGVFAVETRSRTRLSDYKNSIDGRQTILERVRELPDQSFENALSALHHKNADKNPTCLSLACDNRKWVVFRNGAIRLDELQFEPRFGSGSLNGLGRRLEVGWLPITVIEKEECGLTCRQTTYVAPSRSLDARKGLRDWIDDKPLCVAEFTITNTGNSPAKASLEFRLSTDFTYDPLAMYRGVEDDVQAAFADIFGGRLCDVRQSHSGIVSENGEKPIVYVTTDSAGNLRLAAEEGVCTLRGLLQPDEVSRCTVYFPGWEAALEEIADLAGTDWHGMTVDYWQKVMSESVGISIPDEKLQNAIIASQVHCLIAGRNDGGKTIEPWIAAMAYGPLESESNSILRGMGYLGHEEFTRRSFEFFISKYNRQGYLSTGYTVAGTGWHLWTLGEFFSLYRDEEWMKHNVVEVSRACRWVMEQRRKTMVAGPDGQKLPEYGLMPPGVIGDWDAYFYSFYLNANFWRGLRVAGEAIAAIGHDSAAGILADAEEFRKDILAAFRWVRSLTPVVQLQDGTWTPYYPTHCYAPWPIDTWGPHPGKVYDVEAGAHHLIALEAMDCHSREADWIVDHMEDVQFVSGADSKYLPADRLRDDWFAFGGFSNAQPYYTRIADIHALRDDIRPFIRSYFDTVSALLNTEDLSIWENPIGAAWCKTHETGYFLHQSRLMLLQERGDELWLAPFPPNEWLSDGKVTAITNAPTKFGKTSYRIESHIADGYVEAEIEPPSRNAPETLILRLRHPDGKRIQSVEVSDASQAAIDAGNECVRLKPRSEAVRVLVRY